MNDSASLLSSLNLPGRIQKILEENEVKSIEDLAVRLKKDPKSILAFSGIGPKTLLMINSALKAYESEPVEQYLEPVQSLGDQFKSMPLEEPISNVEVIGDNQEKVIKKEKNKGKKSKKIDKKLDKGPKKADKKKSKKSNKKKSKKPDKKKSKKSKTGKDRKAKKNKKK